MSDLMSTLTNLRTLRSVAKEMSLDALQEGLEKFKTIVTEREEQEAQSNAQNAEKNALIEKYRLMLQEEGITPEELLEKVQGKSSTKRAPRPAKYKFLDENGEEKTWTGQGRTPAALKAALDDGRSLKEFEI
ncbi:H-NS histone family protein [Photobacterium makurazakiensis]|uniref:H-NS family histone-like protein n=1 Tax=Photobacterium makurazakiensis TaxID=2910234 RepID=UPI003D0CFB15